MIRLIFILLLCLPAFAGTQILDTITNPDGTLFSGTLTITGPRQTTASGNTTISGVFKKDITITAGALDITLEANDVLVPADTSYGARYQSRNGISRFEYWIVPTSATPLKIPDITVSTIPTPALSFAISQISGIGAAAGDLMNFSTSWGRLPIGDTNGQVLTVDLSLPRKIKWATGGGGSGTWGGITGTLSAQSDLWAALGGKQASLGFTPLNVASNLSDLASAAAARGNLGLGTAALSAASAFESAITGGTSLQFWRGDKSFQTLNTAILPELTNLYFTNARAQSAMSGLYAAPGSCSSGQYGTATTASGLTCAQVAYSQILGTPTLRYQLVGVGGTSQTARGRLNLIAGTNITITPSDNSASDSTDVTITAAGGAPSGSAGGDLSGTYPNPTVAAVGTSSAANVHTAELLANAATDANTPSTIMKRDSSGDVSAGTVNALEIRLGAGTGVAGVSDFKQGTVPAFPLTNAFSMYAPTSIPTSYQWKVPTADAAGFIRSDGAGTPGALSIVAETGTGSVVRANSPSLTGTTQIVNLTVSGTCTGCTGGGGGGGSVVGMMDLASFDALVAGGGFTEVHITGTNYTAFWDGSAWSYFYGTQKATRPPSSGWTWDNQGTSSFDNTNGHLYASFVRTGATSLRALYRTAPAAPYTVTAKIKIDISGLNNATVTGDSAETGLIFRDGTGKIIRFNVGYDSGWDILTQKWTTSTSGPSNYRLIRSVTNTLTVAGDVWLRIADNNTNLIFSWSLDGHHWKVFDTRSRTDHFASGPTQYGIGGYSSGNDVELELISLVEQ